MSVPQEEIPAPEEELHNLLCSVEGAVSSFPENLGHRVSALVRNELRSLLASFSTSPKNAQARIARLLYQPRSIGLEGFKLDYQLPEKKNRIFRELLEIVLQRVEGILEQGKRVEMEGTKSHLTLVS